MLTRELPFEIVAAQRPDGSDPQYYYEQGVKDGHSAPPAVFRSIRTAPMPTSGPSRSCAVCYPLASSRSLRVSMSARTWRLITRATSGSATLKKPPGSPSIAHVKRVPPSARSTS